MIARTGSAFPDGTGGPRKVDFRSIHFPSDALTLNALRALVPEIFDSGRIEGERYERLVKTLEDKLASLISCEREIAYVAFMKAAGREQLPDEFGLDYRSILEKHYIEFDLASGPHHARQLIRDIESQASALGAKHSL